MLFSFSLYSSQYHSSKLLGILPLWLTVLITTQPVNAFSDQPVIFPIVVKFQFYRLLFVCVTFTSCLYNSSKRDKKITNLKNLLLKYTNYFIFVYVVELYCQTFSKFYFKITFCKLCLVKLGVR